MNLLSLKHARPKPMNQTKINKSLIIRLVVLILAMGAIVAGGLVFRGMSKVSTSDISFFAMDTHMNVRITGKDAEETASLIQAEIERLDRLFDVNKESAVSKLNKEKTSVLDEDTLLLLSKSEDARVLTNGAFNIMICPIVKEWGFSTGEYKVPSGDRLKELCELLDSSELSVDTDLKTASLSSGAMVDLGGIAKGYATEKCVDILKKHSVKNALLNLGGNIYAYGLKPDGSRFNIAVKHPYDVDSYLGTLLVTDKAVITSGGYERFFEENGKIFHHIIDPETGYPADNGTASVTIVSNDPTLADALSTALFVMGRDKAISFWKDHSGLFDFIMFETNGELLVSEGISKDFSSEFEYEIIKK